MAFIGNIPYDPRSDPKQYLAQALQQYGAAKNRRGDVRDIASFAQYQGQLNTAEQLQSRLLGLSPEQRQSYGGPTPQFPVNQPLPQLRTPELQQQMAQSLLQKALGTKKPTGFTLGPGQTRFGPGGRVVARGASKRTKTQELIDEGYSRDEAKMIRDISHGLKPRASARKQYENMSDSEKRDFLSKLKQRAEGQYFGIEGGNVQPRQPKLLEWVLQEEAKLNKKTESQPIPPGTGQGTQQTLPAKPEGYPDAEWSDEHGMWTVIRNGRLKGIQ